MTDLPKWLYAHMGGVGNRMDSGWVEPGSGKVLGRIRLRLVSNGFFFNGIKVMAQPQPDPFIKQVSLPNPHPTLH